MHDFLRPKMQENPAKKQDSWQLAMHKYNVHAIREESVLDGFYCHA